MHNIDRTLGWEYGIVVKLFKGKREDSSAVVGLVLGIGVFEAMILTCFILNFSVDDE